MAVFTTLGIFNGLLGALDFGWNAFPDGTPDYYLPYPDRNAFFKVYVGLNHGDMSNAGGDLPDARRKQLLGSTPFLSSSTIIY